MGRKSDGQIEAYAEPVTDGVMIFDLSGKITLMNRAAKRILGINQEDVLGRTVNDLMGLCGPGVEKCVELLRKLLESPVEHQEEMLVEQILLDHRGIVLEISKASKLDGVDCRILVLKDITDELAAERAKASTIQLAWYDLKESLMKIVTALEMLNDTLGKVTPEQRRSLLLDDAADLMTPDQHTLFEVMQNSAFPLSQMIDSLLENILVESGRTEFDFHTLEMRTVVSDVVEAVKQLPARGHRSRQIESEFAEEIPQLKGDTHHIRYALNTLITNAYENTPEDGKVTVKVTAEDEGVLVKVNDIGPSIAEEDKPHLFEPRYSTFMTKTGRYYRPGLGLSKVQEIVRLHHGRMSFDSQPGQETTFAIWLPYEQEADTEQ